MSYLSGAKMIPHSYQKETRVLLLALVSIMRFGHQPLDDANRSSKIVASGVPQPLTESQPGVAS